MVNNNMAAPEWLRKQLDGDESDLLREMVAEDVTEHALSEVM